LYDYLAQLFVLSHNRRVGAAFISQKLLQLSPCLPVVLIVFGIQASVLKSDASLAVIQSQINGYSKRPGVKAASALEFIYLLYYFDKRFLRKFRSIIGISAHSQYDVIDAILILKDKPFHRCRIALPAPLNQYRIINVDIRRFCHVFSYYLDQHYPKRFR
jgi:hypothetical protein